MTSTPTSSGRDETGRFLSGCKPGPGRSKGSRNRHTENFLRVFADDFEQHGAAVIAQVRVDKPDVYLRVAADLLPKEATLDVNVDVLHDVSNALEAFRTLSEMLGAEPSTARLRKLTPMIESRAFHE